MRQIVATPRIYNSWGNFFEQFSLVTGAAIGFAGLSTAWPRKTVDRIGRILLGVCAASFALEQAFYLGPTASLVPKWVPPSQMFWAVTTTVFFALAALALLDESNGTSRGAPTHNDAGNVWVTGWVPLLLSDPRSHGNWSETVETFAIAGATWILADSSACLGLMTLSGLA